LLHARDRRLARDTESQAFIESWFGKLKERCGWRHEFETATWNDETHTHVIPAA
jgi:hypothetical protein